MRQRPPTNRQEGEGKVYGKETTNTATSAVNAAVSWQLRHVVNLPHGRRHFRASEFFTQQTSNETASAYNTQNQNYCTRITQVNAYDVQIARQTDAQTNVGPTEMSLIALSSHVTLRTSVQRQATHDNVKVYFAK